jgi:hypothetical protein
MGAHEVEGLKVNAHKEDEGEVKVKVIIKKGAKIEEPVHMCFGVLPQEGTQKIDMDVRVEAGGSVEVRADCVFPSAVEVRHIMDANIHLEPGAEYRYFERHVHSMDSGIKVIPKAKVMLEESSRFATEFELIKGRVGLIDIDYEAECGPHSLLELLSRISGRQDDVIKIREAGNLSGEYSRGVLTSNIAVRNQAQAVIYNELTATAEGAVGHVDCNEIVQDEAQAKAIPIVDVRHPKAHVTHEAAIGSVDSKQLQTLMSRGLSEDEAVEMIIQGLLRK